MKNQTVKKTTRPLAVGLLLVSMIYAASTLAARPASATTCDCFSLLSPAAADCRQRFGSSQLCGADCLQSGGELLLIYVCCGDPERGYFEQSCQL